MALKCTKDFSWAHGSLRVREYKPGDLIEEDAELAPLALSRGWAVEVYDATAGGDGSAAGAAPRTQDPSTLSAKNLRALLKERAIPFPETATKKHLLELLAAGGG